MKKLSKSEFYNLLKKHEDKNPDQWFCYDIQNERDINLIYEYYLESLKTNINDGKVKIEPRHMFNPFFYFTFKKGHLIELKYTWDPCTDEYTVYKFEIEETEETEEAEELKNEELLKSINMLNKLFN